MIPERLGKLLRTRWALPESPRDARRPGVFVLLFWTCWVATLASHAFGLLDETSTFGLVPVAVALSVLAVVWVVLPWNPRVGFGRKLLAPAFLASAFTVGYLTDLNISIIFYALVVANGVFLFGFRRGIAYAAIAVPIFFANVMLVDGTGPALAATAIAIPFAIFMLGICAAVVEATGSREHSQELLVELESANAELKRHAARVRELSVSEERARMAREIHDSIGHHLTVINLQLQNARRFRGRKPEEAWEEVEGAREMALEALSEVRRSVRALNPLAVRGKTGAASLAALARNFEGTGIEVSFETRGEERQLTEEMELALYRAMQEGLTNAAKHSRARRVTATLCFARNVVSLTVADDGQGLAGEVGKRAASAGFGLQALGERVAALGGTISSGDRRGGGFVLIVELPTLPVVRS